RGTTAFLGWDRRWAGTHVAVGWRSRGCPCRERGVRRPWCALCRTAKAAQHAASTPPCEVSTVAKRPGRQRILLSRELILEAAFRVVDADEANEITMSRLGHELGADPSAMYRHFRNKDELLLAMADVMLQESLREYVEGAEPVENLRRMTWALRRSYLR